MSGLITDTVRLGWAALYWNLRKSIYVLRGRRPSCPCQIASDSGRAYETGCEAVLGFRSPARFRAVCPLLEARSDGNWVCSADSAAVRPFWGRATVLLGALGGLLIIALAVLGFGLLQVIGYDISFRQVVWPPAWKEFSTVQAEFYQKKAQAANARGNLADSLLLLATAYELDPRNYAVGIQLAQLRQVTQPALSDQNYARLLADHPAQREDTAQAWFRALLARGDFKTIQRVAGERLLHSGATASPAWLQAFLHATRQTGSPSTLDALIAAPELPGYLAATLRRERELYRLDRKVRLDTLSTAANLERDAFLCYHWMRYLLQEEGGAARVLTALQRTDSPLGTREKVTLQLAALALTGKTSERTSLVMRLLAQPTQPAVCELLSSHLAAYPEPELLALYIEKLTRDPMPAGDARYPQLLALYAVAGAHRDEAGMQLIAGWITVATGREYRLLASVQASFMRFPAEKTLENLLPVLQPMPLETTYALYARFSPPPPFNP